MKLNRLFSIFESAAAKKARLQEKYRESYHYMRAVELYREECGGDALDEVNLELKEHPDNAFAHLIVAMIYKRNNDYRGALRAVTASLQLLTQTDRAWWMSLAYRTRAEIYRDMEECTNWYNDAMKSVEFNPKSVDSLRLMGDYYYYYENYDMSDTYFKKIIELQPYNTFGYIGCGRNDMGRNDFKSAVAHFDKAIQLDSEYVGGYAFKAEALLMTGRNAEAIENAIAAMELEFGNRKARYVMETMAKQHTQGLLLKLKSKAVQEEDDGKWYGVLGYMSYLAGDVKQAVVAYENSLRISKSPEILSLKAKSWMQIGAYDEAEKDIAEALELNPQNTELRNMLAKCKIETGRFEETLEDLTSLIDEQPDDYTLYNSRGMYHFEAGHYGEAIGDFETALSLCDGKLPFTSLFNGWALAKSGNMEEAMKVWDEVTDKDDEYYAPVAAALAQCLAGRERESQDICDAVVDWADNSGESAAQKDLLVYAAAVYCRTGQTEKAVECLKGCFNPEMTNTILLEPLYDTSEYKAFIAAKEEELGELKAEIQAELEKLSTPRVSCGEAEVPFVREGKMCKVKCTINGLPLHFILDSGASDVTVSAAETTFMLKNGYLQESDMSGRQMFQTADGGVTEGAGVKLRQVEFAGMKLFNVKATVIKNQRAPLLLGQSVLERLGRIEIDNENMMIRIK